MTEALRGGVYSLPAQERVVYGQPLAASLDAELQRLQARRVFVLGSASQRRAADGAWDQVLATLGSRLAGHWGAMRAHTPRDDVLAATRAARQAGADLIVAVGGGSVIDGAKAVQLCLWRDIDRPEAMDALCHGHPAAAEMARQAPPPDAVRVLSVSTTLSAAEFTATAGVTDPATRSKQSWRHRLLVPRVAVLDPAATLPTPLPLLLATGLRAVDHAVESWCSPLSHAVGEQHARLGAQLLFEALPAIARDPADLQARARAQVGMWQAILGSATGAGTGASHGIGYALGATFDVAHGHTSCVLLPAVLRFNAAVNAARQQALAEALPDDGANGQSCRTLAGTLAERVESLVRQLGLPGRLSELGIAPAQFDEIARRALAYEPVQRNPRPMTTAADVRQVLQDCA